MQLQMALQDDWIIKAPRVTGERAAEIVAAAGIEEDARNVVVRVYKDKIAYVVANQAKFVATDSIWLIRKPSGWYFLLGVEFME